MTPPPLLLLLLRRHPQLTRVALGPVLITESWRQLAGVVLRGVVVLVLILCSVCSSKFFFFFVEVEVEVEVEVSVAFAAKRVNPVAAHS